MIPKIEEIQNESDVEQKLIYPILVAPKPHGLGLSHPHIKTKPSIKGFQIDKRQKKKLYYPDYVIVVSGLPMVIIEAKPPSDDLDEAYREARLYATEINAMFPHCLNPSTIIICSNGKEFIVGYWDSDNSIYDFSLEDLEPSNSKFSAFIEDFSFEKLQNLANELLKKITIRPFYKPSRLLGGQSVRNEEIGNNSFGTALALEYRHLFNPTSQDERTYIVKNAYISSKRRERYIEPIDKIVRAAASPAQSDAKNIEDTGKPKVLIDALKKGHSIEHQVLLLVGSVGSGKSTFVDYLREVALPKDLRSTTTWININMNNAPLDPASIYDWICEEIISELQYIHKNTDFEELENIEKIYSVEIGRLKKGVLKLLKKDSDNYNSKIAEEILQLQRNKKATATAYIRHLCAEQGKLAIIVLDNCDKRVRDEQLLMFQAAQWIQREFRCLVFLPLRDITYDNHRNEPPLDTALKDLVFRIEPPLFQNVLSKRIALALKEMQQKSNERRISYNLPNGMTVVYPATELACYLNSILKSIFEYDKHLRRMIVGLAGRDLRKAMEIFIEFCTSGHIGEDEILKIQQSEGKYVIRYHVIARVLLRMNRRFYSSDKSYVKNLFECEPDDSTPVYFVRIAVLRWLSQRFKVLGPTRLLGYHPVKNLKSDLFLIGFSNETVSRELMYLLQARCIIAEHLRVDCLDDEDLICLAPAGFVHLELVKSTDYLAAVSEDTWFNDEGLAREVAERISEKKNHYNFNSALKNANSLVDFLDKKLQEPFPSPESFLEFPDWKSLVSIQESCEIVKSKIEDRKARNQWFNSTAQIKVGDILEGIVSRKASYGIFVKLVNNVIGLAHISNIGSHSLSDFKKGDKIKVRIKDINETDEKISLAVD